jgi:hypothetical protein
VKTYYFVGGPAKGHLEAFRRRLAELGGPPRLWEIYPHSSGDGQALHVVRADGEDSIVSHLAQFGPAYERGPIVEVVSREGQRPEETGSDRKSNGQTVRAPVGKKDPRAIAH